MQFVIRQILNILYVYWLYFKGPINNRWLLWNARRMKIHVGWFNSVGHLFIDIKKNIEDIVQELSE